MKYSKLSLLCVASLTLFSCSKNMSDLDKFFSDARSIPPKQIDPLPEINSPEIFVYIADDLRDPFSNDLQLFNEPSNRTINVVDGDGPDLNRRKELLESFPLDGLYMVGTYQQEDIFWGIVENPEGNIQGVSVNEHMGQNHGKIIAISEDQIDLSEWISDGLGGWTKREASIALREE